MKPRAVKWLNKATQPGWGRLSSALASWHRSSLPTTPAGLPHTPQGPKHPLLLLPLQLWTPRRLFWSLAAYSCDLLLLGSMANAIVLAFLLLCPSAQSCMEKREEINPGHPGCLHRQCMPAALFKVKKKIVIIGRKLAWLVFGLNWFCRTASHLRPQGPPKKETAGAWQEHPRSDWERPSERCPLLPETLLRAVGAAKGADHGGSCLRSRACQWGTRALFISLPTSSYKVLLTFSLFGIPGRIGSQSPHQALESCTAGGLFMGSFCLETILIVPSPGRLQGPLIPASHRSVPGRVGSARANTAEVSPIKTPELVL